MVRIVIILLMVGMAAPASAIETEATGGFILSARGVQFEGHECPPTEHEESCYGTNLRMSNEGDGP
jgi:hypothetical protein